MAIYTNWQTHKFEMGFTPWGSPVDSRLDEFLVALTRLSNGDVPSLETICHPGPKVAELVEQLAQILYGTNLQKERL